MFSLLVIVFTTAPALAKRPEQTCKVTFAFTYTDRLDNDYKGIQGKS